MEIEFTLGAGDCCATTESPAAIESTNDAEVWIADDQALGAIYLRYEIRPVRNA